MGGWVHACLPALYSRLRSSHIYALLTYQCPCRYIINFMEEIPLPPPGKLELRISLDSVRLHLSRPPLNCVPVIRNVRLFLVGQLASFILFFYLL